MRSPKDRSNTLKSMFGTIDTDELNKQIASSTPKVGSGAVKGMDRAFVGVEAENERLRHQLSTGEAIVELDAAMIIPSFVRDRMDIEGDPNFEAFVEGIKENGQKLPILVRPANGKPGYYQAAYGHRRLKACQILGFPVKAIIRDMDDTDLVIAQGVENTERANLSFMEQALFAATLKDAGFSRETIAIALGRSEKKGLAYISILTSLVAMFPQDLLRKIGPAPSIGRPKWEKLAEFFSNAKLPAARNSAINGLQSSRQWGVATSDQRFALVLAALEGKNASVADGEDIDVGGGVSINTKRTAKSTKISIPDNKTPGFSQWLVNRLPELHSEFRNNQKGGNDAID